MNKNEFYKQLMSEYSFDADKIRENAKRGKNARQKLQPMYIGMTAAAAALVVTVGTLAAVNLTKDNGVSLTDSGLATLSANDRVMHAIEQLEKERGSEESKDFLVNFAAPMSPAEVQAVLTGAVDGSMPVKTLYFADGTKMTNTDSIGKVFTSGAASQITGAAVYCTGDTAAKLQSDPAVFLVESMTESDYENAAPVNISEVDTTEVTLPDNSNVVAPPEKPDSSVSGAGTSEGLDGTVEPEVTEEMDGTSEYGEDPGTAEAVTEEGSSEAPADTSTDPSVPENPAETDVPETTDTPSTTVPSDAENAPSELPADKLPEGVTLTANGQSLDNTLYIDADAAFFLTEDTFFVKNSSGVALYRYADGAETLICSENITDPKIVWVDENGGKLLVSGMSDYDTRGRLLCVNAQSEYIEDLHTEDMVMSGVLQSASYNADSSLLVLNVREDGRYYIITASWDSGKAEYIATPYDSDNKLTVAAAYGGTVYFAENSGGTTKLYSVDQNGNVSRVNDFGQIVSVSRNLAFTHAVLTPDSGSAAGSVEVFDPESGKLIQIYGSGNSSVSFGASRHSYSCAGSVYTISGGMAANSGGLNVTAAIDYRKSFSEKYAASTNSAGYVRITDSIYTAANKSALMTFSDITENSSAELRSVVNGAIGVNNVIALGECRQNGITKPETLVECIEYYYTNRAVSELMKRCGISTLGALHYSNGGLTAVNTSDTVLVISSNNGASASGMLYIRAGSFAGKTAYRSVSVSFTKSDGRWKLDSVI